jgi:DNA-binding XRE family transcriptional regulator
MSDSQESNALKSDIYVCNRFKEERERKRASQLQVATGLGVTTKTVGRWEKEIPIPSDKLGQLQQMGFDVVYILTGERSLAQMIQADLVGAQNEIKQYERTLSERFGVAELANEYGADVDAQKASEILNSFKLLDPTGKAAIEAMLNALLTKNKGE